MNNELTNWLFTVPAKSRSWFSVICWWERRRIPYNLIVGAVGLGSLLLFYLFLNLAGELQPGEDAVEPLALIAAPILMNIAYTAGWVVELLRQFPSRQRSMTTGPYLLKLGLFFSLIVVMLPSVLWFVIWISRSLGF